MLNIPFDSAICYKLTLNFILLKDIFSIKYNEYLFEASYYHKFKTERWGEVYDWNMYHIDN